jgi:hypothetical protein
MLRELPSGELLYRSYRSSLNMQAVHITIHWNHEFMSSTDFLRLCIMLVFVSIMLQIYKYFSQ